MESRSWWCQKAGIDKVNRSVLSNSNGSRKIIFGETLGFLSLTKGRRRCRSGNPTSDILAALERRFEGLHGWKTMRTSRLGQKPVSVDTRRVHPAMDRVMEALRTADLRPDFHWDRNPAVSR